MARVRTLDEELRKNVDEAINLKDYGIDLETDNSQHQTRKATTAANKKKKHNAFVDIPRFL